MKKSFGVDTRIKTSKGEYLVETYADAQQFKVISEVFFGGRVLEVKEIPYEPAIPEDGLIRLIQRLQNSVISDIEHLFHLDESVKKKTTAEGLYKIGRLFFKRKLLDKAKSTYKECLKLEPNYADAYKDLGRLESLLGNYEVARDLLLRAIKINPKHPDYYFSLGRILFISDKYAEAKKAFQSQNLLQQLVEKCQLFKDLKI